MSVVTFRDYVPPARYDEPTPIAWTEARIEEGESVTGPWVELETITLDPVDADPTDPAVRNFTTELASDTAGLWYRVVFVDADGDEAQPTQAIQNTATFSTYATVDELARLLKIRAPSSEQTVALERVLTTAAGEINAEVGRTEDNPLTGWELSLAAQVNLERAVEHWQQQEVTFAFGLTGVGTDIGATHIARDTWQRHAHKLAPLKEEFGFA